MGLARSTYYDEPEGMAVKEARLIARIREICAAWPSYGYRRVRAQLGNDGGSRVFRQASVLQGPL